MFKIVLATRNKGKRTEFAELLKDLPVEIVSLDAFENIPAIAETGQSFQENAAIKAETVAGLTGLVTVADDSGLEVDILHGAPGIYSARYAGQPGCDEANNAKLLNELQGIPWEKRTARFRSVIAIAVPNDKILFAEGVCEGLIGFEPKGSQGFGYDPIFIVPEKNLTFAQLTMEEKNKISHRAKAFKCAAKILQDLLLLDSR